MSWQVPFADGIDLFNERVSPADGERQNSTAREILRRLEAQPGLILADEVGMGKTFVALAVGASVALHRKHPVVVMVPSALKDKWPRDLTVFAEKCLEPALGAKLSYGFAERATQFFKLLDDPPGQRKSFIFLTHGALTRSLQDPWVKLALVRETFKRRRRLAKVRRAFPRFAAKLLYMQRHRRLTPEVFERLLATNPVRWRKTLAHHGIELDDDPVPEALFQGIRKIPRRGVADALGQLPVRSSAYLDDRIRDARQALSVAIREVWADWLATTRARSPLLILDEAHHFKNPHTRHASLFQDKDAFDDAEMLQTRGPLAGVFERMLFLTATPFQLGHRELCEVLRRFSAINWRSRRAPITGQPAFLRALDTLSESLDQAQLSALRLEQVWGRLTPTDLVDEEGAALDPDAWWNRIQDDGEPLPLEVEILKHHRSTQEAVRRAEEQLTRWVIRHAKPRELPANAGPRRVRLEGAAIVDDRGTGDLGLEVRDRALLPFLLATRAAVAIEAVARRDRAASRRAVFAEGLASSYEAYRYTRRSADALDQDASGDPTVATDGAHASIDWYLGHLDRALPTNDHVALSSHPKIAATVHRAIELWKSGEKVVVFSHFIRTSQALRDHISRAMDHWLLEEAKKPLGTSNLDDVRKHLERLGEAFFKEDGLKALAETEIASIVTRQRGLEEHEAELVTETVRRFVRTPSFLVRFYPLEESDRGDALIAAFDREDASGATLRGQIRQFCEFLVERCTNHERVEYLDALGRIQTGAIYGREAQESFAADEQAERAGVRLMPNVRLVYGATKMDTRRNLMLAFNTPFFPEVLVASAVLAEGVDLHLFCRHVIHHDLDWNPSTIEQRTGRVDRLGCKAEVCLNPIRNYLPYVSGTHDEKQFRVVRDRERWFAVVMGERFELNEAATSRMEKRVPLPRSAREPLVMSLGLQEPEKP